MVPHSKHPDSSPLGPVCLSEGLMDFSSPPEVRTSTDPAQVFFVDLEVKAGLNL